MLSSAAVKDIGAGTSAGIVSVLVCHPLDTIRVRLQTAPSGRFSGVADVVRQTVRSEGPLALYKGMAFPLAAQGLQKATMFVSFGLARRFMLEKGVAAPGQPLPLSAVFLCGSFAGVCNTLVANPFELVRNRLQVQYTRNRADAQYSGPIDAARQIVRTAGVRSLWLGLWPMILRDAPGVGAWYFTFEAVRRALLPPGSDPATAPKWKTLLAGASAGVAFWVCAFPQDTIKNVIQTQGMNMAMGGAAPAAAAAVAGSSSAAAAAASEAAAAAAAAAAHLTKPAGFLATGARLVREEGLARLWRGFPIAALRGIPGASSTFLTYQLVINYLNQQA